MFDWVLYMTLGPSVFPEQKGLNVLMAKLSN